jgi:NTE family protein
MGAVVGGLHAAGKLEAYVDWVTGLTHRDVLRLLDPGLRASGMIRGEKVMARVAELLAGVDFEDLPVPFTAVATDLLAGKEVWFQQGPLTNAIRASMALPSFISPVMLNGRLLADGGMMNPIPIAPLAAAHADVTVGVSLAGEPDGSTRRMPATGASSAARPDEEQWSARLRHGADQVLDREAMRRLTRWLSSLHGGQDNELLADAEPVADAGSPALALDDGFAELPPGLRLLDVVELSLEALQGVVTRYRLASYPPDLLISIPRNACRTLDFHRGADMIALGRRIAEEALANSTADI